MKQGFFGFFITTIMIFAFPALGKCLPVQYDATGAVWAVNFDNNGQYSETQYVISGAAVFEDFQTPDHYPVDTDTQYSTEIYSFDLYFGTAHFYGNSGRVCNWRAPEDAYFELIGQGDISYLDFYKMGGLWWMPYPEPLPEHFGVGGKCGPNENGALDSAFFQPIEDGFHMIRIEFFRHPESIPVPEPGTILLLGVGFAVFFAKLRSIRKYAEIK